MPPTIRRAERGDASTIAQIHVEGWQHGYRGLLPEVLLESLSTAGREMMWREQLASSSSNSPVFVAEREAVVGFASCGPCRDDDLDDQAGEIYAIYVAPDCWGEGLGTSLLQRALASLADADFELAALWVLESNERARQFYESLGFSTDGAEMTDLHNGFELEEVRYRRRLRES